MVTAIYPGTFDPLTRGHEDLVRRASGLFDKLVVGVADSKKQATVFSRWTSDLTIANEVLGHYPNVQVESFSGSARSDFVRRHDARVIVRGLRAVSDFRIRIPDGWHEPLSCCPMSKPCS
jgi:pantetheine-phosphate adenylyltransferase